jgi:hypothetical protein
LEVPALSRVNLLSKEFKLAGSYAMVYPQVTHV